MLKKLYNVINDRIGDLYEDNFHYILCHPGGFEGVIFTKRSVNIEFRSLIFIRKQLWKIIHRKRKGVK